MDYLIVVFSFFIIDQIMKFSQLLGYFSYIILFVYLLKVFRDKVKAYGSITKEEYEEFQRKPKLADLLYSDKLDDRF